MIDAGWRTLVVNSRAYLGVTEGNLVIKRENAETEIPLYQIRAVMLQTQQATISTGAVAALAKCGATISFCDEKNSPICENMPLHNHTFSAGNLMKQIGWTQSAKDTLWAVIACQKIRQQAAALRRLSIPGDEEVAAYGQGVLPGDPENREGQAAKKYFHRLFGMDFARTDESDVNAALNYGYSIILSSFNRQIRLFGYQTALGVHHCNVTNPFNLACDLMEPFRPFVDVFVHTTQPCEMTTDYKKKLISLPYGAAAYDGRQYSVADAIELYTKDCIDYMNGKKENIGLVEFPRE